MQDVGSQNFTTILTKAVDELSAPESYRGLFHQRKDGDPIPSGKVLAEIIEISRAIIFPGYYGRSTVNSRTLKYSIGVNVERLYTRLCEQIEAGLCFSYNDECSSIMGDLNITRESSYKAFNRDRAAHLAASFIARLPEIRRVLSTDVVAAYNGDPAADSYGEIISCYPVIKALTNYRIAHELLVLGVPLIPRIITEMAHSETGIDIHPGATIGDHFTIDHGTGVVIGATCIIGNNVKLYQGVTLGAKSFPLDDNGNPIKGIPRHPILEDNVIVYSNATVLGRITIGRGAVIGANIWVTDDVAPGTKKVKTANKIDGRI